MAELPMSDRVDVVLPPEPEEVRRALELATDAADPRAAVAAVVAEHPRSLRGWAALSASGRDPIERYACARVGYHRGLDAIRGAGWGGTGWVRWRHESNRGFLSCLSRLRDAAREIGETDEVTRIEGFLLQLDPEWDATATVD